MTLKGPSGDVITNVEQIDIEREDLPVTPESSGAYNIRNETDRVNINGGNENDTIRNWGNDVRINSNAGDDLIYNFANTSGGHESIIEAAAGNDTIHNDSSMVTLYGGDGNDSIYTGGSSCISYGGEGDDLIRSSGNKVSMNGGSGNDTLENWRGKDVTIKGGSGDDYIYNTIQYRFNGLDYSTNPHANIYLYDIGDGNDTILNFSDSDTLMIGSTDYTTLTNGNDLIFNVGTGSIIFKDSSNMSLLISDSEDGYHKITGIITDDSTPTNSDTSSLTIQNGIYDYNGGNRKIENYSPNEKVKLSSDFTGIGVDGNNFLIKSSTGALTLENVRDKLIDVTGADGNTAAYVFMSGGEGEVNGGGIDMFEVIVASEGSTNHLIAGNGGSSLVGSGGVNILQGGAGQDSFVYNSNNDTINNYQSGEIINFAASYEGWATDGNDFIINAAEGSVKVTEANNKLLELADAEGNLLAHVYKAEGYEGVIDGRGFGVFEVIIGADNANNQIYAGAAGSSMWGGRGGSDDELYGNLGVDEYIYSYANGHDNIFQAGSEDAVNLLDISLDQISAAQIFDNGVNFQFTDGGSLNISGQVGTFKLSGQNYGADYQNKSWTVK